MWVGAGVALLAAPAQEELSQHAASQKVLLGQIHAVELQSLIERYAQVELERPLVLGVDHHVIGAVELSDREDVCRRDERIRPQNSGRLLEQQRIEAIPFGEQDFAQNEAVARRDVKRVRQPKEPARPAGEVVELEDGAVVDEDVGDPAGFAHRWGIGDLG